MSLALRPLLERINDLEKEVSALRAENAQLKAGARGETSSTSVGSSTEATELLKRAAAAEAAISKFRSRISALEKRGGSSPRLTSGGGDGNDKGNSGGVGGSGKGNSGVHHSTLPASEKIALLKTIGEECIELKELEVLMSSPKPEIVAYDGFEPSGRMHIAQGLIRALNVNKFLKAGVTFKFWVADWFALMNQKLGGDLKKIQTAGHLMIETWRACGLDVDHPNLQFLWSSKEINENGDKYWSIVLDIATKFNLTRMKKCTQIMGRDSSDELAASQIMYPVMQCADIFFLGVDICSLGVDQRKVNMLAREYCTKSKRKFKPIILSHHMLAGLNGEKMSKSDPDNAVFMDDAPGDVKRKLKKAFCEPGNIEKAPVLEYVKYIIFEKDGKFQVERDAKNGGNKTYNNYESVEADFKSQALHPTDLKAAVIKAINRYLEPVQQHFKTNKEAAALLKKVKGYKITR